MLGVAVGSPRPSASAQSTLQIVPCDSAQALGAKEAIAVCRVNTLWDRGNQRMDVTMVEPILDEHCFWVAANRLWSKADIVNLVRTTDMRFEQYESSDVVVYLTPVMAHAVGVSHRKIRIGSPDNNGDRRFTRTFVKHGGEWRILSHQYLTVATSAPR